MRLVSASSFYRTTFDEKAYIEDGSFVNARAKLFGVADGASEAYSSSNPPIKYGGLTSGQMVTNIFCQGGMDENAASSIEKFLLEVNHNILIEHENMGLNPGSDDVGGASFVVCKINGEGITLVFGGDCFTLLKNKEGLSLFTGFDEAAFRVEDENDKAYAKCLQLAEGKKDLAWDIYWAEYKVKRLRTSNRNIGNGGFATLNGDPTLKDCWKIEKIRVSSSPQFVLLGSDGLLPSQAMNPKYRKEMTAKLGELYSSGGLPAVLKWRDETEESLHHITGWPEASAVELKFS